MTDRVSRDQRKQSPGSGIVIFLISVQFVPTAVMLYENAEQ